MKVAPQSSGEKTASHFIIVGKIGYLYEKKKKQLVSYLALYTKMLFSYIKIPNVKDKTLKLTGDNL